MSDKFKMIKTPCTQCEHERTNFGVIPWGQATRFCSKTTNGYGSMRKIQEARAENEECEGFTAARLLEDNYCDSATFDDGSEIITARVNGQTIMAATSSLLDKERSESLKSFLNEYIDCHIEYFEDNTPPTEGGEG